MTLTYKTSADTFSDFVNKSQYFSPFFSFITVFYIYYAIGIRSDTIWKYLFWVVNCGFYANLFSMAKAMSKNLDYNFYIYKNLVWIETIFFGINEWGFVYINFIKIRSLIKTLKTRLWSCIIYSLLLYTMLCRFTISYYELQEEEEKMNGGTPEEKSVHIHTILYVPMGIIEFIFLYLIVVNIVSEEDNKSKNILNILLHSSLSRMFIVSLLLLAISVIVWFPNSGVPGFIRRFLWRIKGYLGIIFLVDLLLLRIEIDNSRIVEQSEKIKRINLENSIETTSRMYQAAANANASLNSPFNYSSGSNSPTNYSANPGQVLGSPSSSRFPPPSYTSGGYFDNSRDNLINSPTTPNTRYGIPTSPDAKSPMVSSNSRYPTNSNERSGRRSNEKHKRQTSGFYSMYSGGSAISIDNTSNLPYPINGEITETMSGSQKYYIYEEAKRLYK